MSISPSTDKKLVETENNDTKEITDDNNERNEEETTPEKRRHKTLFNDLRRFKRSTISIITFCGDVIQGKLVSYDEVANCVVETTNKKEVIVFGKAISLVAEGNLNVF